MSFPVARSACKCTESDQLSACCTVEIKLFMLEAMAAATPAHSGKACKRWSMGRLFGAIGGTSPALGKYRRLPSSESSQAWVGNKVSKNNEHKVLLQYYSVLQSNTPVLFCITIRLRRAAQPWVAKHNKITTQTSATLSCKTQNTVGGRNPAPLYLHPKTNPRTPSLTLGQCLVVRKWSWMTKILHHLNDKRHPTLN